MIKFFRKFRQRMLLENKMGKYLLYASGEIILVVIGILIALQINNWNEVRKEQRLEEQLTDLLISDLKGKQREHFSDLKDTKNVIKSFYKTIDYWENEKEIDTTNLKWTLKRLGTDIYFQNENSPLYNSLSNSDLLNQLPDSLTKQIDNMYRLKIMGVKIQLDKATEYGTHCKLNFLVPNNLIDLNQSNLEIKKRIESVDKEFISYAKLFLNTCNRLNSVLESSSLDLNKLIDDLESYNEIEN
jgi:hypothetical protein